MDSALASFLSHPTVPGALIVIALAVLYGVVHGTRSLGKLEVHGAALVHSIDKLVDATSTEHASAIQKSSRCEVRALSRPRCTSDGQSLTKRRLGASHNPERVGHPALAMRYKAHCPVADGLDDRLSPRVNVLRVGLQSEHSSCRALC